MTVELLQQIGLTKYEAEGYLALLRHDALTGYELGKRSAVPLPRSYETLERLTQKGFALVQPGEPPRYAATPPEAIIARTRAAQTATLESLADELASVAQAPPREGYWIARGTAAITVQAEALIGEATETIAACGPLEPFVAALTAARVRGCLVTVHSGQAATGTFALLLDDTRALLGTLTATDDCQAITGADAALVAAARALIATAPDTQGTLPAQVAARDETAPLAWLAWETRKQRRLLGLGDTEAA